MSTFDPPDAPTGGRRARWQPHNESRRERIIEALIELLEQTPPGAEVPVQRITERSGLAKSVVYRQFSGREELDRRTRTAIADRFAATLSSALDVSSGSVDEILHRTIAVVVDWIDQHASLYEFLRRGPAYGDPDDVDGISSLKDRIAADTRTLVTELAGVVGVVDEPVVDTMTFAIVSMTEATVTRWVRGPRRALSRERLVGELAGYAWSVLDGAARAQGLDIDPHEPLLAALTRLSAVRTPR